MKRFYITLKFSDGVYQGTASAETTFRAIELATQDARMMHPAGSFNGELLGQTAVAVE